MTMVIDDILFQEEPPRFKGAVWAKPNGKSVELLIWYNGKWQPISGSGNSSGDGEEEEQVPAPLVATFNATSAGNKYVLYKPELFKKIEIDSVVQETVEKRYRLEAGEHTVQYYLKEPDVLGNNALSSTEIETLTIPESVTAIGESALSSTRLKSISIPENIESIGKEAFYYASSLASVSFANGSKLNKIGSKAFYNCGLTSISIPSSVTVIEQEAFSSNSSLSSVRLGSGLQQVDGNPFSLCKDLNTISMNSNSKYKVDSNCLIDKSFYKLISGCKSSVIPPYVFSIGDYAFAGNGITSIVVPDSVKVIGERAFYGCSLLNSVTLPKDLSVIPVSCFEECTRLHSITIPKSVTNINEYAFASIGTLSITYQGTKAEWAAISFGSDCFKDTRVTNISCTDGSPEKTDTPYVDFSLQEDYVQCTVYGDGAIYVELDGSKVDNPYYASRMDFDYDIIIRAYATVGGKLSSDWVEGTYTVTGRGY